MKKFLKNIKKNIFSYYDTNIAFSKYAYFYYLTENLNKIIPINRIFNEFLTDEKRVNIKFLIATQSQGLLLYDNGLITKLFQEKGFYGITKFDDYFYAFYKTGMHGNIISFKITNNKANEIKTRIQGLSRGIHQIDFINNDLYLTNTYDNSILVYNNLHNREKLYWKNYNQIIYPNGKLNNGRNSSNYNHFNSLFKFKNHLYLIAHNETKKTKKLSEIYTIDSLNNKIKSQIDGSNCHNIYIDNKTQIYCKSLEGILSINNEDKIQHKNIFTRGLSITNKYIILGGSDIQANRDKRGDTNGYIFIYDSKLNLIQTVIIKNTQIQEIKMVNKEKTFSNYNTK